MQGVVGSLSFIAFGTVLVVILLYILNVVHKQARRMKDLEQQMNLYSEANEESEEK